jgi:CheY-like chemotaxis protein
MSKRSASKAPGPSHGLGAIIVEVLGKVASPQACTSLIERALRRAKLVKVPEDPVVLLAFASGALREAAGQDFGEETAEELLSDVRPILERAAAHAVAMERAAEQAAAEQAAAERAAAEQAAAAQAAAKRAAAARAAAERAATEPPPPPKAARTSWIKGQRPARVPSNTGKSKRNTWPQGKPAPEATAGAAGPQGAVKRGLDPKRSTLSYQATGEEFPDGLSEGKATIVVVDRDEGLRTTLARMLRREGWAVVTAPDAELGLTLCTRVTAQVVIFDASASGLGARLRERLGERAPHAVALVSGSNPPEVAPVADRVLTKPLAPEQLLAALEGMLPEASRR